MKIFSANLQSLTELYNTELRKALDLEETIVKNLPVMIEKSTDPQLKQAFQSHLQESEIHVSKVRSILSTFEDNDSQTCKVIHALVSEAQDTIKDVNDATVLDAALIGGGQQIEHHEIAVYGTLRTWASLLGRHQDATMLESILNDEKHADQLLSQVASRINSEATALAA